MKLELRINLFFLSLLVVIPICYSEFILDNSLLPKFLGLSLCVIFAVLLFFKEIKTYSYKLNWLDLSLIVFLFFHAISAFQAFLIPEAIYETLKIFLMLCTYFIVAFLLKKNKEVAYQVIAVSAFIGTFIAFFTSFQELTNALKMREALSSANYIITGLFGHKNMLSNWFLLLVPLNALGLFTPTKFPKILFKIAFAIQVVMIGLLMTRAVYLALLVSGFICFIIYKYRTASTKKTIQLLVYITLSFIGISVLLAFFNKFPNLFEFDTTKSSSAIERILVWKKTLGIIKDHFWLGVGAGNWKVWLPNEGLEGLRRTLDGTVIFSRPHNDYLWIWAETGVFGFISFLSVLFFAIRAAWAKLFQGATVNKELLFAFCGFIAYLIIAFFDFPKERVEASIVFAILLAIISTEGNSNESQTSIKFNPIIGFSIALPVLLFSCYFAWVRIGSETNMRKAITAKDRGDQNGLLAFSEKAINTFYLSDNNAVPISWYKGVAQFNLNQKSDASLSFKEAYELNPYNFNVTNNAGTAYFLDRNYAKAVEFYLETLRINPYFDDSKLNLASCYINIDQKENARVWLSQIKTNSARLQELKALAQ